ncbi:hypothetical protein N7456_008804 [Penicillium angulare]|uniref:Uncharacterized protein n=1 Tax=Penicillium angulare TaxID=116970 RepID=A0A9W9F3C9_9EURO|nr:hypothetical protein N7456_008804 [Penicillium angulare]
MAMSTMGIINRGSTLLLLTLLSLMRIGHASGIEIFTRSDSCPSSYNSCGTDVPSDFCCSSSTSCLVVEDATTIICCPSGSSCESINPITCDIQQQNSTAHPTAAIMTTLLDESLPKCGDSCCPFGYSCSDGYCYLNKNETAASTSTSSSSASSSTSSSSSTSTKTNTASSTTSSPSSTSSATGTNVTPIPSSVSESTESTLAPSAKSTTSSEYPSKAIAVGFFPGVLFGAILALLISTCLRHRTEKKRAAALDPKDPKDPKGGRTWSISSPIASEDASYRTDFLLRDKYASMGSRSMRSMLNRSGTRVRSLFSNGPPQLNKDVPPLPTQNASELPTEPEPTADPVTPPRQRAPSTESIKVFSPPGAFAQSRRFLGPEPYPSRIARPSTTFEDLVQAVGFNEKEAKANKYFKVHQVRKIT